MKLPTLQVEEAVKEARSMISAEERPLLYLEALAATSDMKEGTATLEEEEEGFEEGLDPLVEVGLEEGVDGLEEELLTFGEPHEERTNMTEPNRRAIFFII